MINFKILRLEDLDKIISYEKDLLVSSIPDEAEREFTAWKALWRQEALEHYLPLGWSFAAWEGEEGESPLLGYFLSQPILFFQGLTQTLWLEHLQANSESLKDELIDVAYKTCREKHFQSLIFSENIQLGSQNPLIDKLKQLPSAR